MLHIVVFGFALAVASIDSRAQGVVPQETSDPVAAIGLHSMVPGFDTMITGSTGDMAPFPSGIGGNSVEQICDRDCQLKRLDRWRTLIDE